MGKTQVSVISPQRAGDSGAADFASNLQRNLRILFESAHDHRIRTTAPAATEGAVGDIQLVDDGTTGKIFVKFPTLGWLSVALS